VLDLLTADEVRDCLRFVEVMERGQPMIHAEADEWRRRIVARRRFRLTVKTAGSNRAMASRPCVHEVGY
jgi:hypothetical protein